jgi:tRNA(His) 5'-end guanylyltransferase
MARIDGRSFSKMTKGLKLDKPYDSAFSSWMIETAIAVTKEIQGSTIAYTQSDEISILIKTDLSAHNTTWFDNRLQKMCSVIGSIAAANFNRFLNNAYGSIAPLATFDTRIFQVPSLIEAYNNFVWRQRDCVRNSIIGACYYGLIDNGFGRKSSRKMMHKLKQPQMVELLKEKTKLKWEDMIDEFKYGTVIIRELKDVETKNGNAIRSVWQPYAAPKFESEDGKEWFWKIVNAKRKQNGQEKEEKIQ